MLGGSCKEQGGEKGGNESTACVRSPLGRGTSGHLLPDLTAAHAIDQSTATLNEVKRARAAIRDMRAREKAVFGGMFDKKADDGSSEGSGSGGASPEDGEDDG